MNTPYVKQYDGFGVLLNALTSDYISEYPNRKSRRVMCCQLDGIKISKRG